MNFLKRLLMFVEKEEVPRIMRLNTLSRVLFNCRENRKEIPVVNISFEGIGLDAQKTDPNWQARQDLHGELILEDNGFPLMLSIRHISPFVLGCKFVGHVEFLKAPIEKYLKYELAGISMRKVSTQFLSLDPRGECLWFTDGKANELFVLHKDNKIITSHMSFFGIYIEFFKDGKPRMGFIDEDQPDRKPFKGSSLVRFTDSQDVLMLAVAQRFLNNISGLPEEIKLQLEHHLMTT